MLADWPVVPAAVMVKGRDGVVTATMGFAVSSRGPAMSGTGESAPLVYANVAPLKVTGMIVGFVSAPVKNCPGLDEAAVRNDTPALAVLADTSTPPPFEASKKIA